jgi:biofilm PGA synthesis N-glycosyltransferase PgaC
MGKNDYVLVTPARNEEALIHLTIESVLAQSHLPRRWVIVSDASTDRTDEIVANVAKRHSFIVLLRTNRCSTERSFSAKVNAFRLSEAHLADIQSACVGNLDADVSFQSDYFEQLLARFEQSQQLGIAGGTIYELIDGRFEEQRLSQGSVAGAVQLFRRACYNQIGGYVPLRYGGIDSAAEIMARMYGWTVRCFRDLPVYHHRRVSSGTGGTVRTKFRHGIRHYCLGYHPLFELVRCCYRAADRPYVVGSALMACGYAWAYLTRLERDLPCDVVRYLRSEQLSRLRDIGFRGHSSAEPSAANSVRR